nr:putative uncharacterized protein FLJ44672 [Pongo abelii]
MPWWPLQAQLLHPSTFSRPRTFSSLPFQAQLVPSVSIYRLNLCLTAHFPSPACASLQPPRPSSCLSAASTGPTPTSMASLGQTYASQWPFWPSFCLLAASPDPELPQVGLSRPSSSSRWPLQAQTVVKSACPGSAPASRRPLQAQVVLKSASTGPAPASRRPLRVQKFLESASPDPAPPAPQWPFSAQPSSCLLAAFAGPTFDFWRPLQARI